nr:hypothetical protein [Streptomyces sp. NA03103]
MANDPEDFAPSRKWMSSITLDLPALLRLSVSADDEVVSATSRFSPSENSTVLNRASSALRRRSIRTPCDENVLDQLHRTYGEEDVQGQNEPLERYRRGMGLISAPAFSLAHV